MQSLLFELMSNRDIT